MKRHLPLVLIVALLIAFRIVGSYLPESFPNFQPVAALFFCGALVCSGWRSWAVPAVAWIVSYPVPALLAGNNAWLSPALLLSTGLAFAAVYFFGKSFSRSRFTTLVLGSIGAAILFHAITNGLAWIGSPLYAKNLGGLWQSLWTGPEISSIPSWIFLRNMAAANALFTTVFLFARIPLPSTKKESRRVVAS